MIIIFPNWLRQHMVVLKMCWPCYTFMPIMQAAVSHRLLSDQMVWERESSIKTVLTVGFVFQGFVLIFCQQPGPTATVRNNLSTSFNHPVPYSAFTFILVWSKNKVTLEPITYGCGHYKLYFGFLIGYFSLKKMPYLVFHQAFLKPGYSPFNLS